mmetsp:Transcript_22018/g.42041  ORF Transcript_22018/g.42041 Transcript_22018/m.42041 type:complete len:243 (-) Transcript_22018:972-1700(-)
MVGVPHNTQCPIIFVRTTYEDHLCIPWSVDRRCASTSYGFVRERAHVNHFGVQVYAVLLYLDVRDDLVPRHAQVLQHRIHLQLALLQERSLLHKFAGFVLQVNLHVVFNHLALGPLSVYLDAPLRHAKRFLYVGESLSQHLHCGLRLLHLSLGQLQLLLQLLNHLLLLLYPLFQGLLYPMVCLQNGLGELSRYHVASVAEAHGARLDALVLVNVLHGAPVPEVRGLQRRHVHPLHMHLHVLV